MNDADCFLTIDQLQSRYAAATLTPTGVAILHLQRIARIEPALNAFQLIDADGALQAAADSTARWQAGRPIGPLDGVTVTIKDNVDIAGFPTRHGSLTVEDLPATADSPVVARLREAGAVILGKTRLPEFGWKGLTDGPLQDGPTRNPWNLGRSPGGSSGGSAACVAAGLGTFAFGNDGGGSIRIPASFCGLFGIKPTFGRVPHHPQEGLFATLVSGGPLTRTVAEAVAVLQVMARPDDRDWFALPPPEPGWLAGMAPKLTGLRLAYSPDFGGIAPDPDVRAGIEAAVAALRAAGADITEVGPVVSDLETAFGAFWIAGFARRLRQIPRERWDQLDPTFRALAERGLDVGVDAVLTGEAARAALGRELAAFHRDFDLLISPTVPRVAAPVETAYHSQGYDRWRDAVPYTLPFNLTGLPAATLPCGLSPERLPIGLQISGPKYSERLILEACLAVEQTLALPQPHPVLIAALDTIG
ncbi:amidase [Phreatobacter stygius]|uniref:Indoleacetamide hydrolase n=1 Tax=Phreatobacter stygius TaxID=1940610 RepID=A0A4D7BES5_9HYPH|nr:amidase [Phreatobacter stygius]QCI67756.1 amidase [Phreatobacter stygius]